MTAAAASVLRRGCVSCELEGGQRSLAGFASAAEGASESLDGNTPLSTALPSSSRSTHSLSLVARISRAHHDSIDHGSAAVGCLSCRCLSTLSLPTSAPCRLSLASPTSAWLLHLSIVLLPSVRSVPLQYRHHLLILPLRPPQLWTRKASWPKTARLISTSSPSPAPSADATVLYTSPFVSAVRRMKFFSLSSCGLSLVSAPLLLLLSSPSIQLSGRLAMCTAVAAFGVGTTLCTHQNSHNPTSFASGRPRPTPYCSRRSTCGRDRATAVCRWTGCGRCTTRLLSNIRALHSPPADAPSLGLFLAR